MENATKALLMAGGVLIAIIIISLLVRTYGNIGAFQKQQLSAEEAEKLEAYNKEYTKYLNQYVYGTELITVINKAVNNNQNGGTNINVKIKFTVNTYTYKRKYVIGGKVVWKEKTLKKGAEWDLKEESEIDNITSFINKDDGNVSQLKERAFKCDEIKYDNNTGKVNYIHFKEVSYQIESDE